MKTGLSLQALATELERRQNNKKDLVVNTNNLLYADNSLIVQDEKAQPLESFPVNDVAHQQIASRLEIPSKYYNRLRADYPDLLAANVNRLFQEEPSNRMIRTLDGTARAFLSDRYQRIENEEIAGAVLPVLMEQEGIKIESCEITTSRMYIKAVFTKIEREVVKGDVVQAGVAISNSEVGMGSVKIEPLIYRLVCTNGLIVNDAKFTARHLGSKIANEDGIYKLLSDEALIADDKAVLLKVRDVVRASCNEARFEQYVNMMNAATGDKITGNPVEAVKVLAKKMLLSESEGVNVLRHLIEGGDLSRYGILNAVTRSAQDNESYDRATELESTGGNILFMNKTDWNQIAIAA